MLLLILLLLVVAARPPPPPLRLRPPEERSSPPARRRRARGAAAGACRLRRRCPRRGPIACSRARLRSQWRAPGGAGWPRGQRRQRFAAVGRSRSRSRRRRRAAASAAAFSAPPPAPPPRPPPPPSPLLAKGRSCRLGPLFRVAANARGRLAFSQGHAVECNRAAAVGRPGQWEAARGDGYVWRARVPVARLTQREVYA